jgi:uncharacterized membrane protein
MFQDTTLIYIFTPALLIGSIIAIILAVSIKKKTSSSVEKAIVIVKYNCILFGAMVVVLYLSLPVTPSLSTFGYPEDIAAIQEDKKLLYLLQTYNKALVRTTEVLHWFLFTFIWFFLATIINVTNILKSKPITNSEV